jgi:hypothetical protein
MASWPSVAYVVGAGVGMVVMAWEAVVLPR